jgi:hypothetical protein
MESWPFKPIGPTHLKQEVTKVSCKLGMSHCCNI